MTRHFPVPSVPLISNTPANKPLKLSAAGFSRAWAVLDSDRGNLTRGRSLAAIR